MKFIFFILILFANSSFSQSPYKRLVDDELQNWFDPIPIKKEQKEFYFKYALNLYNQDSLIKAGQIFDRIFWLDTLGETGNEALQLRGKIEEKLKEKITPQLYGKWKKSICIYPWNSIKKRDTFELVNNYIVINRQTIIFFEKDSLKRETKYNLKQSFNWIDGYISNQISYADNNEEWFYTISNPHNLILQKNDGLSCVSPNTVCFTWID